MKNTTIQKRITALFFALLLAFSLTMSTFAATDEEKADAKARINEIQAQIDAKKKELDAKESELKDAKKKTENTKSQLNVLNQQSAALQEEITLLEEQMEITSNNIEEIQKEEADAYALFCEQIRQEEERGTTSYWSVLFKASSFADLVSRIDFINEIMEYDQGVIDDLTEIREELQEEKEILSAQEEEKNDTKEKLNAKVSETDKLLQEYKKTQEGLQAQYDAIKAEEDALDGLMDEATQNAIALGVDGLVATSGGYAWPLKEVRGVTSYFGGRKSPGGVGSTNHKGVDFAAAYCNVYASKSGTVTWASWNGGYGNCIIIQHGQGNTTLYGHLSSYKVKVGDTVTQGQCIGVSGNTGASTGPHLHFGITEGGNWIDPLNYLTGWYWCGS